MRPFTDLALKRIDDRRFRVAQTLAARWRGRAEPKARPLPVAHSPIAAPRSSPDMAKVQAFLGGRAA
jgi:hypothetical protein